MRYCPECKTRTDERLCPTDGSPTLDEALLKKKTTKPDPLLGSVFDDRFEVIERIGRGGMGSVYRARQLTMGREVALKVLNPNIAEDEEAAGRFVREAKVASRLRHPNTIVIHDFGHCQQGLYMALELLHGETLSARMKRARIPAVDTARYGAAIARSLAEAHAASIVHRDLKPQNVYLHEVHGGTEVIKVLDFGVAKFVQDERTRLGEVTGFQTAKPTVLGTAQYMAPEQIRNQTLDGRCDLYALGVILYEMLAGRRPFEGDSPIIIMHMHMQEEPEPLPESVPEALRDLVHRLLAKLPANRPATAEDVAEALEGFARSPDGPRQRAATKADPAHPGALRDADPSLAEANTLASGETGVASLHDARTVALAAGPDAGHQAERAPEPPPRAPERVEESRPQTAVVAASPKEQRREHDDWDSFVENTGTTTAAIADDELDDLRSGPQSEPAELPGPRTIRDRLTAPPTVTHMKPEPRVERARPQRGGTSALMVLGLLFLAAAGVYAWMNMNGPAADGAPGRVALETEPPGATVTDALTGRKLGVTPLQLDGGAQEPVTRVRLTLAGHLTQERSIAYPTGSTPARVSVPMHGTPRVSLLSDPEGATVTWVERSQELGQTPLTWQVPEATVTAEEAVTIRFNLEDHAERVERLDAESVRIGRPIDVKLEPLTRRGRRKR